MKCTGNCNSQCDNCHDLDNCVEAVSRRGDLILCARCTSLFDTDREAFDKEWLSQFCSVCGQALESDGSCYLHFA